MKTRTFVVAAVAAFALLIVAFAATRGRQERAGPDVDRRGRLSSTVEPTLESIPRISAAALREKLARNEVVVIDVRDAESYLAAHIPGSLQIPLSYIEGEVPYLRASGPIVTYCT